MQQKTQKNPAQQTGLIQKSQAFTADIFKVFANAPQGYRDTIVKDVEDFSCNLIHTIRISIILKADKKKAAQSDAIELMRRLEDLIPVCRRLGLLQKEKETELLKKLTNIQNGYRNWINSLADDRRLS